MDAFKQTIVTYNQRSRDLAEHFFTIRSKEEYIVKAFSYIVKDNVNVVECGCGAGKDAMSIIKYTKNYLGIDISKHMISLARKNCDGVKFEVGNFLNYKYPRNIDIIFAFASLLHSSKVKVAKFFKKIHHVLNTGGVVCLTLKYGNYHSELKKDKFGSRLFYFYTPDDIKLCAGIGYESVYEDSSMTGDTKWFVIILKKI